MPEKPAPARKLSEKSTKQEMLDAYQELLQQVEARRAAELNPTRRIEERRTDEAIKVADGVSPEGIDRAVGILKSEIGKALAEISEKLAAETSKYKGIQKAISSKEQELQELYGIEKAASTLAALIEAQNQKRREFDAELAEQKGELAREIEETRARWEEERRSHDAEIKERDAAEKKLRDREKEDYTYLFKREQASLRDKLADEKALLEKEIRGKKEAAEKELTEREKGIAEKERDLAQMQARIATFPKELDAAVDKAVKEISERLKAESKNREELLRKEHEGERNVLGTRIELLEKTVKDLSEQNTRLARQAETAYQKVQEIAEKAIEGSSQSKSLADLQKLLTEQARKPVPEKS